MNTSIPPKRLYLDTSVISAFFDQRAPERKRMTEEFWQSLNVHKVFISTLVLEELDAAQDDLRTKLLKLRMNLLRDIWTKVLSQKDTETMLCM